MIKEEIQKFGPPIPSQQQQQQSVVPVQHQATPSLPIQPIAAKPER